MSLKQKAFAGAFWTTAARLGERASVFLIMLVLLRLLDVHEFGTSSTAVMMITVLWPVARFGSYNYIIQHSRPDDAVLTGAMMASLSFSVAATVLLAIAAVPLGYAFNDPALAPVLIALSPVFILKSLGTVPEAVLTKQFGFRALTIRQLTSVLAGGLVAIATAAAGWGIYALVVQQLVMALVSTVMTQAIAGWKLDVRGGLAYVGDAWAMGSKFTVAQLLTSVNLSGYGLIIGLFLSTKDAGLFRLGFAAVDLATQVTIMPFVAIAVPIFARLRDDRNRLRSAYLSLLKVSSFGTYIIFAWMAMMGPEVGRIMYGKRFDEAATLIPIFCVAVFASTTNRLISSLLSATGRAGEQAKLALVQAVCALALASITSPFGLGVAAAGHVLRSLITTPLSYRNLKAATDVDWRITSSTLRTPLLTAAASVIPLLVIKQFDWFTDISVVFSLPLSAFLVGSCYIAILVCFSPGILLEMIELVSADLATRMRRNRIFIRFSEDAKNDYK